MEDQVKPYVLDQMVEKVGMPVKFAYTVSEVARASGVPNTTLLESVREGRIQTFLAPGRTRGRLIKPEWFEEWWNEGIRNAR